MGVRRGSWCRLLVLIVALSACATRVEVQFDEDCPNPDDCGPGYHMVAGAMSDEAVAFNVIVTEPLAEAGLQEIGNGYSQRHGDKRVVVTFFAEGVGEEQHGIELGMFPDDPDTMPRPPSVTGFWLATFDYLPGADSPRSSQFSGRVTE